MLAVFLAAIFTSAALLFLVQPMLAKMALPLLGGSPSVWNTCMVFFQALLLAGYGYSHLLTTRLKPRAQLIVHGVVMLIAVVSLPIALPKGWSPPPGETPTYWLLALLAVAVGLPFFVVSTTGPLLQHWFSRTGHARAADPYFLYAASNLGSVIGLLAYPLAFETTMDTSRQGVAWAAGYGLLAVLVIVCGLAARSDAPVLAAAPTAGVTGLPVTRGRRAMWTLLAFVPSSYLLGVTQHLSTDVAAVPMLWVIPLLVYLLSFVVAFSTRLRIDTKKLGALMLMGGLAMGMVIPMGVQQPLGLVITLHVLVFAIAATLCHAMLAKDRPGTAHLTEFYFFIALGGVLGGAFNALLAPKIFNSLAEYPVAIALACAMRPAASLVRLPGWAGSKAMRIATAVLVGVVTYAGTVVLWRALGGRGIEPMPRIVFAAAPWLLVAVLMASVAGRGRVAMALVGVMLAGTIIRRAQDGTTLYVRRTFFGIHEVYGLATRDPDDNSKRLRWNCLRHGTTFHGAQSKEDGLRRTPTSYYHPTSPIGDVFRVYAGTPLLAHVGAIGLGTGSLAAYAGPGQRLDYFEIDPGVRDIAQDMRFFTYLADARQRGATVGVKVGDGRLEIGRTSGGYGLIVVDAFSSDAIPVHLMTREAVELYRSKLAPGGIIAFHVSNRYFDLIKVLRAIADDLKMVGAGRHDSETIDALLKKDSIWVVLADKVDDLKPLLAEQGWETTESIPSDPRWTDRRSNVLDALISSDQVARPSP
jgi:hypothetical protein